MMSLQRGEVRLILLNCRIKRLTYPLCSQSGQERIVVGNESQVGDEGAERAYEVFVRKGVGAMRTGPQFQVLLYHRTLKFLPLASRMKLINSYGSRVLEYEAWSILDIRKLQIAVRMRGA